MRASSAHCLTDKMFDLDGGGTLDAAEFKTALPLMGENVPQAKIDELYNQADTDGSGEIDYEEFCFLVKKMNPKELALSAEEGVACEGAGAEEPETGKNESGLCLTCELSATARPWCCLPAPESPKNIQVEKSPDNY